MPLTRKPDPDPITVDPWDTEAVEKVFAAWFDEWSPESLANGRVAGILVESITPTLDPASRRMELLRYEDDLIATIALERSWEAGEAITAAYQWMDRMFRYACDMARQYVRVADQKEEAIQQLRDMEHKLKVQRDRTDQLLDERVRHRALLEQLALAQGGFKIRPGEEARLQAEWRDAGVFAGPVSKALPEPGHLGTDEEVHPEDGSSF